MVSELRNAKRKSDPVRRAVKKEVESVQKVYVERKRRSRGWYKTEKVSRSWCVEGDGGPIRPSFPIFQTQEIPNVDPPNFDGNRLEL